MNCKIYKTIVAALIGLVMSSTASTAADFSAGPPNPNNGFAEYVTDANGLSLELCLSPSQPTVDPVTGAVISPVGAAPFCFFDPPDPANAFSTQIGFGAEGFWWLAQPVFTALPATITRAVLVLGAEAAFVGDIVDGGQFPFTRLRVRLDVAVAGHYRVTEPYGVHLYNIQTLVAGDEIFESFDVQFTQGTVDAAGNVTDAVNTYAGPWLTWDTFVPSTGELPDAPGGSVTGFIGDGATPHLITGSPTVPPTNFFKIAAFADAAMNIPLNTFDPGDVDGDGSDNSVTTNLFTVVGKLYDGRLATPMVAERTTYTRDATGLTGQADVFTRGAEAAIVSATGGPNLGGPFGLLVDQGSFFESELLTPNALIIPPTVEIDATDVPTDPTHLVRPLVDLVSITRAEYDLAAVPPTLTVEAVSSDALNPPVLTVVELNRQLTAGSVVITETSPGVPIAPPGSVTVSSSAGGSATRLVETVNSDEDGDGIPNTLDNCPLIFNPGQEDVGDGDGVGDVCDNCTLVANGPHLPDAGGNSQRDTDGDGFGNICDADIVNTDGLFTVNLSDFSAFRSVFGKPAPGVVPFTLTDHADFNGDGSVNLSDFSIFRASFGRAPGPSALNP